MSEPRVLHRDEHVLALDKPAGALVVPGRDSTDRAQTLWAQAQALAPAALPVHRLDRGTSGIVLFALSLDAQRTLSAAFEAHRAQKTYLALVKGRLAEARCELPLLEARAGAMRVAARDEPAKKHARTDFLPLEQFADFTWALCRPLTGRTHQIRVHLAALGHPLAIDPRYGSKEPLPALGLDRTPLHAASIRVPHPAGGWLHVESPLPADLAHALEILRSDRRRQGLT